MDLTQKLPRTIFSTLAIFYIIGSAILEVFFYFLIADDVNQGSIPWEDFWNLSLLTLIRFLVMLMVMFIMFRIQDRKLLIFLLISSIVESILFFTTSSFIFYPPLISNILVLVISGIILRKLKRD